MDQSTRPCRVCGIVKPENGSGDRPVRCRDCYRVWRRSNRTAVKSLRPLGHFPLGMKNCATCEAAKRPWDFPADKRVPSGLHARCRSCIKLRNAEGHRKHQESRLAASAERRKDPDYLEAARVAAAEWRRKNPAHAAFLNRASRFNRRAAEAAVQTIPYTPAQLSARIAIFGGRCWMCSGAYEHLDHVKPISRGGPNMLSNLRPACSACNLSKRAKWFGPQELHRFIKN